MLTECVIAGTLTYFVVNQIYKRVFSKYKIEIQPENKIPFDWNRIVKNNQSANITEVALRYIESASPCKWMVLLTSGVQDLRGATIGRNIKHISEDPILYKKIKRSIPDLPTDLIMFSEEEAQQIYMSLSTGAVYSIFDFMNTIFIYPSVSSYINALDHN